MLKKATTHKKGTTFKRTVGTNRL